MSDIHRNRQAFLETLNETANGKETAGVLTRALRQALLDFGSETPDNLNCASRVEVGRVGAETGPKLTGHDVMCKDIAHALECVALPAEIKDHVSGISEEGWDAFTRLTTLIYILLTPKTSSGQ